MEELRGRGAVVVGGGSGIGRGIAMGLAAEGASVVVADIDPESAAAVSDEITFHGGHARSHRVDATDDGSLTDLADRAETDLGKLHVLANTVGVVADTPLIQATEAEWAWFVEFHLMTAVRSVNVFVPRILAHGEGGHVVLTSSMAGLLALPPTHTGGVNTGLYTVMKHALVGYSEMLRGELAPENIGVSVLCPGRVDSNLGSTSAKYRPDRYGGALPDPMEGRGPLQDVMPNEDVGPIVVRGITANRAYIITHPETAPLVKARQDAVMADYEFFADAASTEPG
jgi:NAD(P)-dependent dehydrogenase (short-subunit alcohol dehydrogenase family)